MLSFIARNGGVGLSGAWGVRWGHTSARKTPHPTWAPRERWGAHTAEMPPREPRPQPVSSREIPGPHPPRAAG